MVRITLDDAERDVAIMLGKRRNSWNTDNNTDDRRASDLDPDWLDIIGVGAELAVAKYMNLYPDLEDGIDHKHYDIKKTFKNGNENLFDVKCATKYSKRVFVNGHKKPMHNLWFVFVWTDETMFPTFTFHGWEHSHVILDKLNYTTLGVAKPCYVYEVSQLRKFE